MSKSAKIIYEPINTYPDRHKDKNENLESVMVRLDNIETMLLLFDSAEDEVLLTIFKHLVEYVRRSDNNIVLIKEVNILDALIERRFYRSVDNVMVKRLALYLGAAVIENTDTLTEMNITKINEIVAACVEFYINDGDSFCIEYLTVIINKCFDDPQAIRVILENNEFLEAFFKKTSYMTNPDVVFNSFEILEKIMIILCTKELRSFIGNPTFPSNRLMCELTNDFMQIRTAALKVISILIKDENSPLTHDKRDQFVLKQLVHLYCEDLMLPDEIELLINVLAAAMRNENMAIIFFELNLFEKFVTHLNDQTLSADLQCRSLSVLTEIAVYPKFLERLVKVEFTERNLNCFLNAVEPNVSILTGLNRLMKSSNATNIIIQNLDLIPKIVKQLPDSQIKIKAREQLAELLKQLLNVNYHSTAEKILVLQFPLILANIFSQVAENQSTDLYLTLLIIIEDLSQNANYRQEMCSSIQLIESLGNLLKNSFSTSILVSNIFRCLCCVIEEENIHDILLETHLITSIKRGLKSRSNTVKVAVTNFIMQTTRFIQFVENYIYHGVLEILLFQQQHAFCIQTWNPAIDSILSKHPTLKFCIRNHLSFTDTTAGHDFYIPKMKFEDFRDFTYLFEHEVTPIQPVLVMNFDRPENPPEYVIQIPRETLSADELQFYGEICYCRKPGDPDLQLYVKELSDIFDEYGLDGDISKRCIDFESIAKRAKLIAEFVVKVFSTDLKTLDLNSQEDCNQFIVKNHLKELSRQCHTTFIPIGSIRSGCQFERAVLFKGLADQLGLPCTLQRSVNGDLLFNEIPLPIELEHDKHCDKNTLKFMPWRMLRPTHIVDLMYNIGELYPMQSRQALQYLRLC